MNQWHLLLLNTIITFNIALFDSTLDNFLPFSLPNLARNLAGLEQAHSISIEQKYT
jgi:hypothetical protein